MHELTMACNNTQMVERARATVAKLKPSQDGLVPLSKSMCEPALERFFLQPMTNGATDRRLRRPVQ